MILQTGMRTDIPAFYAEWLHNRLTEGFVMVRNPYHPDAAAWRYDPVVLTDTYTADWHISAFSALAKQLSGYTHTAVFSFLQLYKKVRRNFPEAGAVSPEDRLRLARAFAKIGAEYGMTVKACGERADLVGTGVDCSGCMMPSVYQNVLRGTLHIPHWHPLRDECDCFLGNDIGAYNSCPHLCRYCYANYDAGAVRNNIRLHDPKSPFLIGVAAPGDIVRESDQKSWLDNQLHF